MATVQPGATTKVQTTKKPNAALSPKPVRNQAVSGARSVPHATGLATGNGANAGIHIQTRFADLSTGRSLHPDQRTGRVAKSVIPVQRAGSQSDGYSGGSSPASQTNITQPPTLFLGGQNATHNKAPKVG